MNLIKVQRSTVITGWMLLFISLLLPAAMYGTTYTVENSKMAISVSTTDGTMVVSNKTTHTAWQQEVQQTGWSLSNVVATAGDKLTGKLNKSGAYYLNFEIKLQTAVNEFELLLWDTNNTTYSSVQQISFPHPFVGDTNCSLVVPHRMGLNVPVTSKEIWFNGENGPRATLEGFMGHAMSMNWFGLTRSTGEGLMTIVNTPNDYILNIIESPQTDRLAAVVQWRDQKRMIGYTRSLRFILLDSGNYNAMCARYRTWAQSAGYLKTLLTKASQNPNVYKINNAAIYWPTGPDATSMSTTNLVDMATEMKKTLGLDKMVFYYQIKNPFSPAEWTSVNDLGYLVSRYNNYNSFVLEEERQYYPWPGNPTIRPVANSEALIESDGTYADLWSFSSGGFTGYTKYWSDAFRIPWVMEDKTAETNRGIYLESWFIDTAFGDPWREDYDPAHPMTRSQCRDDRIELFNTITGMGVDQAHMVVGVESGVADGVPVSHWFEGKLTVAPFDFVNDQGTYDFNTYSNSYVIPFEDRIKRSHEFQVPLWELVFGDCVKSSPRWEQANNKSPRDSWWKRMDLYCALYGEMQMFVYTKSWYDNPTNKTLLSDSYSHVRRAIQEVGFSRMTNHSFMTSDKTVQRTSFENGTVITANFGDIPYLNDDGVTIPPLDFQVTLDTNGIYILENKEYLPQRFRANGNNVFELATPPTGTLAEWKFKRAEPGYYFMVSSPSATTNRLRALTATTFDLPGTVVTGDNARWKFINAGNGYYVIENKGFHQCLAAVDGVYSFALMDTAAAMTNKTALWRLIK